MIVYRINWVQDKINATSFRLRMRVKWNGSKCIAAFALGYAIESNKYLKDQNRARINTTHGPDKIPASEINRKMTLFEQTAEEIFQQFYNKSLVPTVDEFKQSFNATFGKIEVSDIRTILDTYDTFVKKMSLQNEWQSGTIAEFKRLRNLLNDFCPNIQVNSITEDTMLGFQKYLIDKGNQNTTIAKNIKLFLWFLRWCSKSGLYNGKAHENFKPRLKKADAPIIYLTWEELQRLYNMDFDRVKYSQARDVFCFCCFSGLRYSDVRKLQKSDIVDGKIKFTTQKTTDSLEVELNKYSKAILDKYEDVPLPNNKALPVFCNQKENEHLKTICRMAEMNDKIKIVQYSGSKREEKVYEKWQLITTHCGRKTFVVNSLYLGIPAEVIMRWTGHSDYNSMKPYIDIVDELKKKEMDKFNTFGTDGLKTD